MSGGGLIHRSPDERGYHKAEDRAGIRSWREDASCPWCGAELDSPQIQTEPIAAPEILFELAVRFAEHPIPWMLAMLLINNQNLTTRQLAAATGIHHIRVHRALVCIRKIAPGLIPTLDTTARKQKKHRAKKSSHPLPRVGTLPKGVLNRFARRCRFFPEREVGILLGHHKAGEGENVG